MYYAIFFCGRYNIFKLKKKYPEKMKKLPSQVAHNWPKFFFSVLPTGPK